MTTPPMTVAMMTDATGCIRERPTRFAATKIRRLLAPPAAPGTTPLLSLTGEPPRHRQAYRLARGPSAGDLIDYFALVQDDYPIGQRQDLLQFVGDEDDARPLGAQLEKSRVNELDRPDIEAPRGLRGDQHARAPSDFAGQDQLLLVAP